MTRLKLERGLALSRSYGEEGAPEPREATPDWSSLRDQVRHAGAAGYDAVVVPEINHDPYLMLAIAAQEPSRLELVTSVALCLTRSPTSTAYTAWDLQRMSGGRLVLGLGSQVKGHVERRFSMPFTKPAQRMKEYVQVLRACWKSWQDDVDVNFEGECYSVTFMPPHARARPPQAHPHIPVHIAAVQARMLQVAGEVCDGVRLHEFATRRYMDEIALPNLRKGFERSGLPEARWQDFEISGGAAMLTAADNDGVARLVDRYRMRAALYASTRAYRDVLAVEGWGDVADELNFLVRNRRYDDMSALITDEMIHRLACVGRHDQIADIIAVRLAGTSRVRVNLPIMTDAEQGATREILQQVRSNVRAAPAGSGRPATA